MEFIYLFQSFVEHLQYYLGFRGSFGGGDLDQKGGPQLQKKSNKFPKYCSLDAIAISALENIWIL